MARSLLSPERPRLLAARAAVEGYTEPVAAWEALAGADLIPIEWIIHDHRAYTLEARDGRRHAYFPPTIEFGVLLAADVEAVRAAEAIARDAAPDIRDRERVEWHLLSPRATPSLIASIEAELRQEPNAALRRIADLGFWINRTEGRFVELWMPGID